MRRAPYRWVVGVLLFFVGMLTYLDRTALSVAAPLLRKDFGLDDAQMGFLFSAFFVGYSLFCFIGGWAADHFGPRKVFAWAVGVWSLFCAGSAFAGNFAHLLVVRMLFGAGEGPMGTTTNKSIANWFPQKETGRAVGITNAGQPLGAALAAPLVGLIALHYGWRVSFVVIGLLGVVWLVPWLSFFRDQPAQQRRVDAAEVALIERQRPQSSALQQGHSRSPGVLRLIFSAPVQGVAAAFFCFNYVLYFFLSWLPSYLTDYQHLDLAQMSIVGILPWLAATFGFVLGGLGSDLLYRWRRNVLFARKAIIVLGLGLASASVLFSAQVSALAPAISLIAIASLFAFMTPQACWSLLQDVVPSDRLGATGGFVHFVANIAGVFSPSVTGWLIQYAGGYHSAFVVTAAMGAAGMLSMLLVTPAAVARLRGEAPLSRRREYPRGSGPAGRAAP